MNKKNKYYTPNIANVAANVASNVASNVAVNVANLNKKKFNIDILFEKIIGSKTNISLLDNFDKYKWCEFI
jgi:hypothetical protein